MDEQKPTQLDVEHRAMTFEHSKFNTEQAQSKLDELSEAHREIHKAFAEWLYDNFDEGTAVVCKGIAYTTENNGEGRISLYAFPVNDLEEK